MCPRQCRWNPRTESDGTPTGGEGRGRVRESDVLSEAVPMLCFVISCDMITMARVACSVCSRHEAQPPIRIP